MTHGHKYNTDRLPPLGIKMDIMMYGHFHEGFIIEENGIYNTTLIKRTGCVYCGFGVHLEKEPNRFQKLKISHPKIWGILYET